ncbi:MAG: hypothetical protein KatS3mg032_0934 [Cyclobacteriaceae bacterium]|nr:MAG: hypothetical protein KatS3mg032_0934 [Cyclobacteriaceae bacterium]
MLWAQNGHDIVFPDSAGWNILREGEEVRLQFRALPGNGFGGFSVTAEEAVLKSGLTVDTTGMLSWTPPFTLVNRLERVKEIPLTLTAQWHDGTRVRKNITLLVHHTNRPPVVEELPVFYVRQGTRNTYTISSDYVYDPDADPLVFRPVASQMPEGAVLSEKGVLTWAPGRLQFNALKNNPLTVEFVVQDQPDKAETTGKLRIAQTQLDLPPEILIVPNDTLYTLKENETLGLKIYVTDPNGEEDVRTFEFVASDPRIPLAALKENTVLQYEFVWSPGYDFTDDVQKELPADIVFFALDKAGNRSQRKITVRVQDAENLAARDALQYAKYRTQLVNALDLIVVLDQNQKKLNEEYKKAKKGKRRRSVVNASLGAVTGFSPVVFETDQAKVVSAVGGTTVVTLNTLEATEVIGKSKDEIMERIKINIDIRNKVQAAADEFARKYTQKSARRTIEFEKDIEKLRVVMNDQRLVLLELEAYRKNQPAYTDRDLRKAFVDFVEFQ